MDVHVKRAEESFNVLVDGLAIVIAHISKAKLNLAIDTGWLMMAHRALAEELLLAYISGGLEDVLERFKRTDYDNLEQLRIIDYIKQRRYELPM